ncbi:hypothetical protein SK128_028317 [Halocaridina rubra]|uniref:Uncharacterized protein n=1 Tax=Halocaridina rubra TaxID=373956 RepID=A0AAN8XAR9_HALRR
MTPYKIAFKGFSILPTTSCQTWIGHNPLILKATLLGFNDLEKWGRQSSDQGETKTARGLHHFLVPILTLKQKYKSRHGRRYLYLWSQCSDDSRDYKQYYSPDRKPSSAPTESLWKPDLYKINLSQEDLRVGE